MTKRPFVPQKFKIPEVVTTEKYRIRLLEMNDLAKDYNAYMTSIDHVQGVFDPNDVRWPTKDVSIRLALADLGFCEWEHYKRTSFSYGVFSLDDAIELGCIYVHQTWKPHCDAQLIVWVRQRDLEKGLDEELFAFAKEWVDNDWPVERVAYPGRSDGWNVCSRPLFVPQDFVIPTYVGLDGFHIRLMTMDDLVKDYEAYMSNIDHIRGVFGPDDIDWPAPEISLRLALADLGWCEWEHFQRSSFSYCVMTPDDSRELGCLYISPTEKAEYDAEITSWVVKAEYDKGLDSELFDFSKSWIKKAWPFKRVAFPGREVSWDDWAALPEA